MFFKVKGSRRLPIKFNYMICNKNFKSIANGSKVHHPDLNDFHFKDKKSLMQIQEMADNFV